GAANVTLTPLASVPAPTGLTVRANDPDLYVTEQVGLIRRLRPTPQPPYQLDPTPVLDITSLVHSGGEQGLLGLAFSADGNTAYVAFTNTEQNQELDAFTMKGSQLDPSSRRTLLVIPDFAPNHNGGDVLFGPDGNLYWTMGDGGGAGDPKRSG